MRPAAARAAAAAAGAGDGDGAGGRRRLRTTPEAVRPDWRGRAVARYRAGYGSEVRGSLSSGLVNAGQEQKANLDDRRQAPPMQIGMANDKIYFWHILKNNASMHSSVIKG